MISRRTSIDPFARTVVSGGGARIALLVFLGVVLSLGPAFARTVLLDGVPPLTLEEGGSPEPPLASPAVYPGPSEIPGVMAAAGPQYILEGGAGTMSGVPGYYWRHGCGPTSAGMVLGYWDSHGFPDLVVGDAGSQTSAVNDMVANTAHYNDYSLPDDTYTGGILQDKSELGGAHADNCVADFIRTSWSSYGLRYGWSFVTTSSTATFGMSYGMKAYTQLANPAYGVSTFSAQWDNILSTAWTSYKGEIDAGRPVVILVDTDGDAATDHMVAGVGYNESGATKEYICYNTWDYTLHTYLFRARASGVTWGVAYGIYYRPTLYTISGTVTSGGPGLSGVTVTAGSSSTTTAGDGTYTLANLGPATYTVTPTKTGYTFSPVSASSTVGPSQSGVNFTASAGTTYDISGTITVGGAGLSGVTVDAGGGHTATTASDGTYTIAGLSAATYTVTPSKTEHAFSPTSLSVTVGPTATGQNFTATVNTYTISGTVTSGGSGFAGVTVTAGGQTATSAGDGTYTITGLVAGAYTVTPSKTEYTFSPTSLSAIVGPNASGKDFTATQNTYTISGTITASGTGLGGVTASAGGQTAVTASNGIYTITGLVAGDYTVTPTKAEYTFSPTSRSVSVGPNATGKDFVGTQTTYTISGTIAVGGTGLSGVTVDAGGSFTTTTAGDGTYTITGVTAATYTVTPSKTGYTFSPTSLSVTVGPNATGKDFAATANPETANVSGTVTSGGSPLAGVTLDAGGGHTAVSASDGTYVIADLSVGLYTITPSKAEYTFSPATQSANVGGQGGLTGKDFVGTQNTYSVSGTITAGGAGLSGVTVDAGGGHTATTASDGTYTITGLVAGTYTATPTRAEYTFSPTSRSVTVGPNATGKDFAATLNTYTISGTISFGGSGLAGVLVSAGGNTATTAGDGVYTISGLAAGTYTVAASNAGYILTPATLTATVGPNATGKDFTASQAFTVSGAITVGGAGLSGVTVTVGGETATTASDGTYAVSGLAAGSYTVTPAKVEYTFSPASRSVTLGPDASGQNFAGTKVLYSISGTISAGGSGLAGALVAAGGQTATTAANGAYTITGLEVGSYAVTATLAEYTFSPVSLSVAIGPDATGKNFTATQKTYSISGTITSEGSGVGGIAVSAGGSTATTASDGAYSIAGLVAGTYSVTPAGSAHIFSPASLSVTVGPNATGKDFAASAIYSISGAVSMDGAGVEGVTVTSAGQTVTTAANGAYLFSGLVAGTYTVTAAKDELVFSPASLSVTVGPDATGKDFEATPQTYTISGTITSDGSGVGGLTMTAGGVTATTASDGTYTLAGLVVGAYTVTPSGEPHIFSPASLSVTVGPDATGKDFTASAVYSISGAVLMGGAGVAGVTVVVSGQTVTTAADGAYSISGLVTGVYTVAAIKDEFTFTPSSLSVTVGPDAAGKNFTATQKTYRISGFITAGGVVLAGVTVQAGGVTATTAADGSYMLAGLVAGTYTITPSKPEFTFSPASLSVTVGPDAAGKNLVATRVTYTITGTVGLDGSGLAGIDVEAGGASVTTAADGSYSITGLVAGTYSVVAASDAYGFDADALVVTVGPSASGVNFSAYQTHTRTVRSGWSMLSIPLAGLTNSMGELLGDPALNSAYWDAGSEEYVILSGPPALGQAYWIRPPSEMTLVAGGTPTTDAIYVVQLQTGWQMVGNPFLEDPIDWTSMTVRSGGSVLSLAQAASSGLVTSYGWVYDPNNTTYQLVHDTVPGALRQIEAWQGFFIYANQPVELILPRASAQTAALSAPVPLTRSEGTGFTLGLSVQCEGTADVSNTLGVAGAGGAFERGLTVDEPPQLPNTVNLSFISPETGLPVAVDIRSAAEEGQGSWEWDVLVRTDIPNSQVLLSMGDMRDLARDYQVVLTDVDGGESVYLRTTPSYAFRSGENGAARHFKIAVSRREAGLRIVGMSAQMVRSGGASVAYTLSASARVSARILNAAGRVIAEPALDDVQAAGARELFWNGRNTEGSRAPAGAYMVELRATTETGEQASGTMQVRIDPR